MYGRSAGRLKFSGALASRGLFVLLLVLSFVLPVGAQSSRPRPAPKTPEQSHTRDFQRGRVVSPSAEVYATPDFDAKIIGNVKGGSTWMISKKIYGAFYQVKLPKNRVGYVTDADIRPVSSLPAGGAKASPRTPPPKAAPKAAAKDADKEAEGARLSAEKGPRPKKPFEAQDFQGVSFMGLRYREDTMGLRPTDNLMLIGFKATGADVIVQGLPTELNVQISPAAPKYYEQATGRSSEGFLFLLDTMALNTSSHGPNSMTFFGFGPVFRFSKFSVTLPINGKDEFYSLEDMALGLKLNYGISQRFDNFAMRLDFQYFWEKSQYYGLSLAFQFSRD